MGSAICEKFDKSGWSAVLLTVTVLSR